MWHRFATGAATGSISVPPVRYNTFFPPLRLAPTRSPPIQPSGFAAAPPRPIVPATPARYPARIMIEPPPPPDPKDPRPYGAMTTRPTTPLLLSGMLYAAWLIFLVLMAFRFSAK